MRMGKAGIPLSTISGFGTCRELSGDVRYCSFWRQSCRSWLHSKSLLCRLKLNFPSNSVETPGNSLLFPCAPQRSPSPFCSGEHSPAACVAFPGNLNLIACATHAKCVQFVCLLRYWLQEALLDPWEHRRSPNNALER